MASDSIKKSLLALGSALLLLVLIFFGVRWVEGFQNYTRAYCAEIYAETGRAELLDANVWTCYQSRRMLDAKNAATIRTPVSAPPSARPTESEKKSELYDVFLRILDAPEGSEFYEVKLAEQVRQLSSVWSDRKGIYFSPLGAQCGAKGCDSSTLVTIEYGTPPGLANPGSTTLQVIIDSEPPGAPSPIRVRRIFRLSELLRMTAQ